VAKKCNQRVPEEDSCGGGRDCGNKAIITIGDEHYCASCARQEMERLRNLARLTARFVKAAGTAGMLSWRDAR